MSDRTFKNSMLCDVSYDTVIKALHGKPFPMELVDRKEIKAVIRVVNQGIDSHLEACNVPDRGDSYQNGSRPFTGNITTSVFRCNVSPESLPVLLRRLSEDGSEAAENLASCILESLHIDDYGNYHPEWDDDYQPEPQPPTIECTYRIPETPEEAEANRQLAVKTYHEVFANVPDTNGSVNDDLLADGIT